MLNSWDRLLLKKELQFVVFAAGFCSPELLLSALPDN
jgi:hypothetical protein